MKQLTILFFLASLIFSCETQEESVDSNNNNNNNTGDAKIYDVVGKLQMNYGPHAIAVSGNYAYAVRDDKMYIIDISDVTKPTLIKTLDDLEENNIFEVLAISGTTLYAGCTQSSGLYAIDISNPANATIVGKYKALVSTKDKIKIKSLFVQDNFVWAGGSNGLNAMLAKFNVTNPASMTVATSWTSGGTGNVIEGVWANEANVFISCANGHVYSLSAANIPAGTIGDYTFNAEAGHEHWGKKIVGDGTSLYWADWGAGFIVINIADPTKMASKSLITHSSYISQHPDAEGTNCYDLVLDKPANKIFVANGWSGLLTIDLAQTDKVASYVDYKDDQYYCIAQHGNYVIVGDIAAGTTDIAGIKIIKVK